MDDDVVNCNHCKHGIQRQAITSCLGLQEKKMLKASNKPRTKKKSCQCEIDGNDVCEEALDKFVHRIILSASMNQKDGDKFGIADVDDGKIAPADYHNKPRINGSKLQERYEKSRKNASRKKESRKSRWEKSQMDGKPMPKGTVQTVNGKSYVNVPLEVYRKMVEAEIDAKMKQVSEYQEFYLNKQDDLRLDALREAVYWQEYCKKLETNLSIALEDLQTVEKAFAYCTQRLHLYESYDPTTERLLEQWMVERAREEVRRLAPKSPQKQKAFGKKYKNEPIDQEVESTGLSSPATTVSDPDPVSVKPLSSTSEHSTGATPTIIITSKQRRNKILRGLAKGTEDLPTTT